MSLITLEWERRIGNPKIINEETKSFRSSGAEVFLTKGVLKIYSKFTGEHPTFFVKLQKDEIVLIL